MADFSLSDLQGAFEGALKSVFGGNSGAKPSTPGGGSSSTTSGLATESTKFTGTLGELARAGAPVVTAFLTIGSHGKEAATVFGQLAKFGDKLLGPGTAVLSGFVKSLEEGRDSVNQAGKQGVGGNNLLEFAAQTKAAGMTMDGNLKLLKDMGPSLTGIGLNAQDANQRFLKLSQDTIESKLGQSLATAQGGVEGLNAAASIMAANTKKNLREDAQGRAELAQSSAELANQIDLAARATGKSRESIEAELKERLKSPEAILAMNLMTDKQREAFTITQASLKTMGPSISGLAETIASGGRMTKENMATLNALGPAAGDFQRAIRMQQTATDEASKKQADAALLAAKAKINEYQSSERNAKLALQGTGEVAEMQKKLIVENKERAGVATVARETGQGFQQAQQTQAEISKREQEGKKSIGPDAGKTDEGQTATRLLNASQENFRKNAVAGATELVKLNDEFGRSPKLIKAVADSIEVLSGKFGETSEQKGKRIAKGREILTDEVGLTGTANTSITPTKGTPLGNTLPGQAPGREIGSKAATGNWFEDFGAGKIMELHKKEAVVPQDKMPEFMKDMMSQMQGSAKSPAPDNKQISGMKDMMTQMQGASKSPASDDKMISGIASQMQGQIKSPSPDDKLISGIVSQIQGAAKSLTDNMSKNSSPIEQIRKQMESVKMPEIKMPKASTDILGQLEGQFKGLTASVSKIKQPEFQKLPMLPKASDAPQKQPDVNQAAIQKQQNISPAEQPTTQNKKIETSSEDVQTKILEALNQLNKTMGQMAAHTSDISDASAKSARYAGKAGSRTAA